MPSASRLLDAVMKTLGIVGLELKPLTEAASAMPWTALEYCRVCLEWIDRC
ncbi:hypothetical protein GGD56_004712 [Rhizobium mongolense]|uniref:Uncharacterized protein n=2 Tax=Rhizobium mongolense TaxID=57676 RepID=A0ABR6ISG8_9HYPH|nr:hypothetical protein [Rhizobium mongolense]TVZ66002.1 hypothetical protein BCL32_6346 [Rhizobium mongolense USDA 1844]